MKIRYENSLEDLVAFNRYHCDHSPTLRQMKWLLIWAFPLCILLVAVPLTLLAGALEMSAAAAAIAALYALVMPGVFRRSVDWQTRKLYSEGANKGVLGEHELELTGDDLIERTPYGEQRMQLQAIERVATAGGYTFIYLSAIMAFVVPQDAVLDGDYEAFVERIKQRTAARYAEPDAPV